MHPQNIGIQDLEKLGMNIEKINEIFKKKNSMQESLSFLRESFVQDCDQEISGKNYFITSDEKFTQEYQKMLQKGDFQIAHELFKSYLAYQQNPQLQESKIQDFIMILLQNQKNDFFHHFFNQIRNLLKFKEFSLLNKAFFQMYYYFVDFKKNNNFLSLQKYQTKKSRFQQFCHGKNQSDQNLNCINEYLNQFDEYIKEITVSCESSVQIKNNSIFNMGIFHRIEIDQISCSENHILFLTKNGQVIAKGSNKSLQCNPFDNSQQIDYSWVCFYTHFTKDPIKKVKAYQSMSLINSQSHVIIMGLKKAPLVLKINQLHQALIFNSKLVIFQKNESMVILPLFDLFQQKSKISQNVHFVEFQEQGLKISMKGIVLKDVKGGNGHLLMLDQEGIVYGYGDNSQNQLHHSDQQEYDKIIKLQGFNEYPVLKIHCSMNYSIIINQNKELIMQGQWGNQRIKYCKLIANSLNTQFLGGNNKEIYFLKKLKLFVLEKKSNQIAEIMEFENHLKALGQFKRSWLFVNVPLRPFKVKGKRLGQQYVLKFENILKNFNIEIFGSEDTKSSTQKIRRFDDGYLIINYDKKYGQRVEIKRNNKVITVIFQISQKISLIEVFSDRKSIFQDQIKKTLELDKTKSVLIEQRSKSKLIIRNKRRSGTVLKKTKVIPKKPTYLKKRSFSSKNKEILNHIFKINQLQNYENWI